MSSFKKATKEQARLRLAISGASGGGKTYSALAIATNLGKKVAVIDTEQGSASKYSDTFDFDVCEINNDYNPSRLITTLKEAGEAGYDVGIIDSGTHFWNGPGGFLDLVDQEVKRMQSRGGKADSFAAWKAVTPVYNRMIQAMLSSPMHIIVTLRAKQEYSKENGKVQKLGVAPEMRDGFQYELDIEGLLNDKHELIIGKTRCPLIDGKVFEKPGKEFADILKGWLADGVEPKPFVPQPEEAPAMPPVPSPLATATIAFSKFADALKAAKGNADELSTIRSQIVEASKSKQLGQDETAALSKLYMECK